MIIIGLTEFSFLSLALFYVSNLRLNRYKILIEICFVLFPALIGYYFFTQVIGALIFTLALMISFYFFTKEKWVLIDVCIVILIGIFSDNIAQLLRNLLLPNTIEYIIIHIIFFVSIFNIFIILYKTIFKQKLTFFSFSFTNYVFFVFYIMIMVLLFYIDVFILDSKELIIVNVLIQLTYLSLISLLLFLLNRATKKEYMLKQKEILQQQFNDYMKDLASTNEEMQRFRHDYLNILLSIRSYIDEKNFDGLESYFYDYIFPTKQKTLYSTQTLNVLEKIKVMEVKSIIASKLFQAERVKTKINLEIPEEILNIPIDPIDLTRVLGIYLDNALEASLEVTVPEINIAFLKIKESIIIIIENKCDVGNIYLNDILGNQLSTKSKNRGIGLKNARTILTRYRNVTFNTRINDPWFIQEIEITGGS